MSLLLLNVAMMKLFQRKFKIIFYIMMTLQDVIAEIHWGSCLLEPFFVSEWSMMRAHDDMHSEIEIEHGIGDWPVIVDVQIKPISKTVNDVFVFTSYGSANNGDDQNLTYGGIIYIYDKTKIKLFAPNKKDGISSGTIIFTGDRSGRGERIQNENEVMVRTRVWRYIDVPKPDFETDWMYISSENYRTEASSQDKTQTILWGGANYAYDSKNIRIWIPFFGSTALNDRFGIQSLISSTWTKIGSLQLQYEFFSKKYDSEFSMSSYTTVSDGIFSIADGWGKNISLVYSSGKIKVRAWSSLRANQTTNGNERLHSSQENPVIRRLKTPINQDVDILSVLVKANDVDNSGFLFPVSGTIQHNNTSSNNKNGLIYAYSELYYKVWFGNVKEPSFQHKIIQRSSRIRNNIHDISAVDIVINLWKPNKICHSTTIINSKEDNTTNVTGRMTAETTDSISISYTTPIQPTSKSSISGTMIAVIVTVVVLVSVVMAGLIVEIIIRMKKE